MISTSFVALVFASSALLTSAFPNLVAKDGRENVCGTTDDADLGACQSILDNWPGELRESLKCHFGGFWRGTNTAYNVASVEGCSVYVVGTGKESQAVKEAVQNLMGCADESKGKVNGVTTLADGTFVCVGGNDGCGDCFDDSDIDHLTDSRRRHLVSREPSTLPPSPSPKTYSNTNTTLSKRRVDYGTVVNIGSAISDIIANAKGQDDTKRANVIRNMVDGMAKHVPGANVVACHTDHEAKFDGEQGKDWIHEHFEVDISLGGTIGYELYMGNSGTFKRNGDGGTINWGYNAVLAKDPEEDGSLLTFAAR
jgi:hypothetical protein